MLIPKLDFWDFFSEEL